MAERPLYTLYKNLKAQNYDVPNDYNKFESALTRDGKSGADNRHAIYENLKAQNFDVPDTYERFYSALFEPRSKTSSRAKGGSVPMSAADRARFSAGAAAISASAKQMANNAGRYNRLKQRKQKQQKDFGRVNLGTHLTPFGGDANNVVKDEFAYNPETGKAGAYVTSDNENAYSLPEAEQRQKLLDKYGEEWNEAVDMGMVPSELDKADPNLSDTDVAMRQIERRQEWLDENQNRRSKELNESMHLQGSPFVASGGAVAPSSFNTSIGNEANRLSDVEYGAYNTAKAYNQMLRTTLLQELKEQKQKGENVGWWKDKWNDVSNYFGGMLDTMLDPKLFSQGVMDAAIANNMLQVKKGMEDGTIKKGSNAGNAAQAMFGAIQQQQGEAARQQQNGAKAYQYGDMNGRSLKFIGDFLTSGWRNVMTTGFTKAGEKVGEKMALGALGKWFTKNTGRVLGDIAGSAALAATNQLGSTYNNVIERYVGMNNENGGVTQDKDGDLKFNEGVSLGKAIKDGFGSATIENFSEMFGEYLPGASNLLSKLGLSKVSSFFEKIGNNAFYKWLSNATNKSGIQGVMAEISEEEFGTALHAAWGDGDGSWSDFNVFTNPDAREKQIDTCLGMFYSVGFMQAPRTAVGAINAVQYFKTKHQVNKADKFGQGVFNDKWDEIKNKIDVSTNADLTKTVLDATRSDSMTAKQKGAVINYAMFLSKLRGFNQAADAKTKDKVEEGDTAPTLSNDLDDAYTEGHNADDADKHDIQIQQEDQMKTLAAVLGISEQQLSAMSDDELESMTGQDDKLDQAIYDYQLSSARYQGVVDDAQDKVDLAAHQAEQRVDMYTDRSRGSVRNATIKASGGAEDYGVYIISGNIATNEDGSINVSGSDSMILYYDPTTDSVEHADALMFAELGEELPADDVKTQAVADAKENAIKEIAGIIDGTVDVGSQFTVTDADGTEHTYEVLADNGDGTAMITIDGNIPTELVKGETVQIPYPLADLQQMKDLEDQKRLEAAKAEREQMEKERAAQQTQETEETQPSFDFNQILNDDGNVVLVDVLDEDGNTKYPDSKLFLIRDAGAKAKVVELKSDGTIVPHAVNKEDVATISSMSLDEYKQAMPESSMIEDNSGENRGGIEAEPTTIEDETTPDVAENTETTAPAEETTAAPSTEQAPAAPAITLEDGTIVPMLEDGNPDFSKLTAEQTAELYDTQFGEDADGVIGNWVSEAKKALDKANNMTVKGKTFVEQKAAKDAKEKAIADAQAAYDSAIAIRDSYNNRQLAKAEGTPEGRRSLVDKARRKFARLKSSVKDDAEAVARLYRDTVGSILHSFYDGTGIDVTDTVPLTAEEYVASNLGAHSLNYEGNETSKGVKQETGLSREDFAKTQLLAADGKGTTIDALVHSLWDNRPSNLESLDTQDIRNALIDVLTSGFKASEARSFIENIRIAQAEKLIEEERTAAENAAYAEQQKAKEEEEKKKAEEEDEETSPLEGRITETDEESEVDGEYGITYNKVYLIDGDKRVTKVDEPDEKGDYTGSYYMYDGKRFGDLFEVADYIDGNNSDNINEKTNEQTNFPDKLKEGSDTIEVPEDATDENPLGQQKPEEDLPFSAKENGTQQTTAERAADVEKNKVDDIKVVDNIVGQKTRKAFERLAKMMGAEIQWQYSDKLGNGWIEESKDADGNVHRTIFITLDSSITEGAQFIFGHEMTHQIKNLNPAAYNELTQLVLDTYGSDAFDKAVDETMQRYSDAGFSGRARDYYAEEVVADAVGEMIRDLNLAHTLALKMSHPLLAAIHEILQKIKLAFFGTEYSDVTKNIIRSIEQAYVKTAKGEVSNTETGEDVSFSLRQKPEPKKKGIGYKVFVLKDGKLYPPMVANPDGAATPVGVWLDADAAPIAGESKTGRPQVKQGGKGTQGGSGKLAYRPGWHLGVVPYAIQFNRKDAEGNKTLFPKNFVFAEVEYAADVDYQEEARQEGINPSGKYQHSLAGLKHLPTDGYYMYRTNPNPETDPWVITGAMKVNRILTRAEQAELVKNAGREPQQIQEGDIVTDDVVNSINQEIANAPKFSLKVYHGSGADFTEFDFDHMGEGAGSQAFGWGGYVTSSKKIGKDYARLGKETGGDYQYMGDTKLTSEQARVLAVFVGLPAYKEYSSMKEGVGAYIKSLRTLEQKGGFMAKHAGERIKVLESVLPKLDKVSRYDFAHKSRNLYEVDIPEDNGSNYLDFENPMSEEQINAIRDALAKKGVDVSSWENRGFKLDLPFKDVYAAVLPMMMRCEPKEVSKFLSSIGYTGIKYPAGTIMGGAEEDDTNYVIFKPEDMKITEHTKFSLRLKSAIEETETNPSDAQKESGNYKKGHIKFGGYDYTIENPKGSIRSGKDANGKEWKVTMHDTYGYIRGKYGKDGDHLDMFINDKADLDNWNGDVFVVDQVNPDGSFDEHKVMYGYDSMDDAEKAYLANYSKGWKGLGNITGASKTEFDKWLDTSNRKLKPFADYAKVKFSQAQSVAEPRQSLDDIKPVSVGAFGNIYNQFRGKAKAAIEFLKKLGSGEATAALHHHTIGDISLVWGDKKTGLDKILRKHPEVVDNLQSIIDSMEVVRESDNRIKLESPTHFAVVSKEYKGEPREQWLLTAYEKRESLENGKSMDTATSSLGGDTALSQSKGSAAKIDNSSETSKENGEKVEVEGTKFSLKDEKTMFGMHNISVDKLRKAIKQGGFAAPSMGVVDSKNGIYSGYGEITLIPKAEKIAKRTGKNIGTYAADAWTPIYPPVEKKFGGNGSDVAYNDIESVPKEMQRLTRNAINSFMDGREANGLAYLYLQEKGKTPELVHVEGKYPKKLHDEVKSILGKLDGIYSTTDEQKEELLDLFIREVYDGNREEFDNDIKKIIKKDEEFIKKRPNSNIAKNKQLDVDWMKEHGYDYGALSRFVDGILRDAETSGKVDENATMKAAQQYIQDNSMKEDFDSWKEKLNDRYNVEEVIFAGYKPDGNRKYLPNTVENAVKVMKQDGKNASVGSASFSHFVASILKPMGTLDQIRKKKGNLTGNYEDVEKFQEKWQPVYDELADKMQPDAEPFESYGMDRLEEAATQKNPKKYAKDEYGVDLTDEDIDKLNELIDAVKNEKPSIYFETKFMRPYGLDEFEKAIVPNDTPSDVVDALKMAGIDVSSYERGNAEDRQKVTMDAINNSDNIRFSLAGERGAAAADKAEERTIRMDNLSVAKDMEKNKKKAKAIKAATGWERGADGKWRYEMPDVILRDPKEWVNKKNLTLSDIVEKPNDLFKEYPELFDAYPELKDVKIQKGRAKMGGSYYDNTITLNLGDIREAIKYDLDIHYKIATRLLKRTLVHEVQHYIQHEEGFAKGGSQQFARDSIKDEFEKVIKQIRGLRAEGKEDEAKALVERNKALYNAYANEKDSYKNYKSLSGEVEARNVSARLNMTPEERRKSLAESTEDVARKDQIFLGVGDVSFSLRDMADGKESGAADMAEDLKSLNTPDEVDDAIRTAIEEMPSGWQMANKKMIHVAQALGENRKAEIAGEEPKFSLKDGSLIKAGTYFSGGGLVEEGLKGIIDPVVAVEYDEKISGVYRNNFGQHIVTADVRDVDPKELVKQIDGEVEYFHASPVCKNYSQAKSNHAEVELDKETAASTAEFINAVKPKVVTIENVKGYKDSDSMKTITDALDANGYTWDADVYNAADYGGYTNRERLIVRAVRDGKLPDKPKKMEHKSGWYEAVADIIPTLTEKKNGVAPWMDIRLKADGIDWRNIDKPLYVMGSAYADGKIPHAFADELLPTLRTKSGDVIVMPDGKVYRAMGRVLARVSGVSDDYKMPFSESLSHTIIGNGIPTQLTEHVIAPLLTGSDPKFSIRTYHGTGASFDKFDFSHMGEGEGSQAFGWGGYVTNSKEIAEDYTRRAKIRKDNGGFEFVTDMSANNKDMVRQYIYKYKDVNKGLDAMRKDLSSALEMFPDDEDLKELSNILAKKNEEIAVPDNIAYLYDVDIPDDNGDYLDWDAPLTDKQKNTIIKALRRLKIDFADFEKRGFSFDGSFGGNAYDFLMYALRSTKKWEDVNASRAVSKFLSSIGFKGIKYKAGTIFGGAKEGDYNYVIFDENNANIVGNARFSLRYDQFEHDLNQWKKDNNLPKDAQRPTIPQRNAGESAVDFLRRVDEYRKQMALWKTAPTYEQHLLSDDTALGEFNRELQRGSVLKRIAFQDSMLAIRKAQEAIMKEVGVDRLNMAEDAYTAENRSHGKGKNEFEEYNNEFLQPLRKAYHQMKKVLGDSYDNVRIYMMAKHGLERDAQMAFKKSLEADYEDVSQRSAAYRAYKGDMNRIINDSDLEFGRVDFTTWRQRDNALRVKYSPSYMNYRYDKMGIAYDYSGLSALFDGSDFEEAAHKLVKDIEDKYVTETHNLWDATNAATKKILRDGYKAGMMSKDTYQYVRDMYSHYIPLRGWDGTTADQVWDYIGGGKGAFNQTLKTANGRTSIADDPIAYIENMAESGILLNNKNWVKQHLMLLAQNHPTSLLTLSKAWYVKSTDANGNEEWIPATPQITSQMNSNQVKAAIDAFEQKMEQMAQTGDATQKRDGLNIAYPQTHSEEREHEVRVMKDGEEYVIYVNGDPQLAQAMNNTRAHRVREIQSGKLDRAAAWLGRKMAAAYTSLSPLFIPSNYFRDLTMTLASTAIREDGRYNYLLRKNLATSWNLGFILRDYQSGKLREKVSNGNATAKEQMFYDFMMNGGETGFVSSLDVEDLKKKFKNDLKDLDRWKANPVKVGHTIMDGIEFLNRAIEDSNRFAIYMTSIQYGRSIDEAVNDAKDVTLNFNRKGTGEYGWQMVRNLYLFINPAVQSLQTLGALAKHHPFKFTAVTASWLASGVLVPIVNAAMMSLLGGDDDKDKYWQFTKWDRRNNLIMWVPFTHEYVKIPLAQEFRAFYGIGDMIASKMMGGELAEESWSQYAEDMLGQVVDMLPLDPTGYDGNIAVSLMPNAIRPVFELAFNVDFTGKPLFKDSEYNKYDPNFTKAYVGTPDWLVRASKMVNSIGNDYPDVQQNSIDAFGDPRYNLNNPAVVDHVLSSYLGGAYTMGSQVLGVLTKALNDPKEIKMADIPLLSKFVSNPDDRPVSKKQGDEFWNMKDNHDRAANTLSKLKKQAKVDGDYSMLERFYGSEEYKQYKQDDVKVKKYEEDKKKERAEESGEEYRPHKLNAEDIYKAHATPKDDFEDMKLKQIYTKLNGFKSTYDLLADTAPSQSDAYYNTNKVAIDAIDEISLDKQEISELKKGFLDDGKEAYNAEDMNQIRELRKKILAVLEKANKVVVANQKAKAKK